MKAKNLFEGRRLLISAIAFFALSAAAAVFVNQANIFYRITNAVTLGSLALLAWGLASIVAALDTFTLLKYFYKRIGKIRKAREGDQSFREGYHDYLRTRPKSRISVEALTIGGVTFVAAMIMAVIAG